MGLFVSLTSAYSVLLGQIDSPGMPGVLTASASYADQPFTLKDAHSREWLEMLIHPRVNPWCSVFDRIKNKTSYYEYDVIL